MQKFFSSLLPQGNIDLLDPAEVSANRMGQISPAQEQRLSAAPLRDLGCGSVLVPFFVVPFICFWSVALINTSNFDPGTIFALIPLVVFLGVMVFSVRGLWRWWQAYSKIRSDRENRLVRSDIGELGFDPKKGFVLHSNEEIYQLPPSKNAGGLLPGGRYTFYYLPESRIILSAEQFADPTPGQVRAGMNRILADANKFTQEELEVNRQNEISSTQRSRLIKNAILGLIPVGFVLVIMLFIAGAFLSSANLSGSLLPMFILFGGMLVLGGLAVRGVLNTFLDMNSSVPEIAEGVGTKISRRKSSGKNSRTVYYYVVDNHEFEVPLSAYNALIEGMNYRIYFSARSKLLLSIEVLDASNPSNTSF